jgi:polyferredoxin
MKMKNVHSRFGFCLVTFGIGDHQAEQSHFIVSGLGLWFIWIFITIITGAR